MSPHLIATMGAPGAGKSTWAQGFDHVISTDAIRHGADMGRVYRIAMREVESRLHMGQTVVFDATCANPLTRDHLLDIAERTGAHTTLVVFDTPLPVCLSRQDHRDIPAAADYVRSSFESIAGQLDDVGHERWGQVRHELGYNAEGRV